MQEIVFEILENDYNDFLKDLYKKYGISKHMSFDDFKKKYSLNRLVFYKTKTLVKRKNNTAIPNDRIRCTARVWGGKESVIKNDGIWSYGYRCKRRISSHTGFCLLHSKKQPHGIYNLEPPHNHYDKYKID
jgi:hypothetical protein